MMLLPRTRGLGTATAALLALLLAAEAHPVRATVVVALDLDQLALAADRVVLATVTSVSSRWTKDREAIESVIDLEVQEEVGGISAAPRARIVQSGGRVGDRAFVVHGMPRFAPEERVLLFLEARGADEDGTPAYGVVGMAQGKFAVLPRLDGGFDAVQDLGTGLALAFPDADGTLRPNPQHRPLVIELSEAIRRIRTVRGEVTP
jgi:hypothetical protein